MYILQVFEHETLRTGDQKGGNAFTEEHFQSLIQYNELHQNKYFTVVYQGVKFSSYVGVIQTGDLTIEILPKADKASGNYALWHNVLLDMLIACNYLQIESIAKAQLNLKYCSLLDIYFNYFLDEVEGLVRKGLIKKYRKEEENQTTLRGNILFAKHLQHNLIHQERFYTRHQVYDQDHLVHQILFAALEIITNIPVNSFIRSRARKLILDFPEISSTKIFDDTFDRLQLDRKTSHYQQAIAVAKLILLNHSPDIKGGQEELIAILFDMNRLFEEYVYLKLKEQEKNYKIEVLFQEMRPFWENKIMRSDILIKTNYHQNYVIDTKWKVMDTPNPSDADLRQIYVYNHYYDAYHGLLLYPKVHAVKPQKGAYKRQISLPQQDKTIDHFCEVNFVNVLDEQRHINQEIGMDILKMLNIQ